MRSVILVLIVGLITVGQFEVLARLTCSENGVEFASFNAQFYIYEGYFYCYSSFVSESILLLYGNCTYEDYMIYNYTLNDEDLDKTKFVLLSSGDLLINPPKIKNAPNGITEMTFIKSTEDSLSMDKKEEQGSDFSFPKVQPKFSNNLWLKQQNGSLIMHYVSVMNSRTIIVHDIEFNNYQNCSDPHFWVGKGESADQNGQLIPDENSSLKPLKDFSKELLVLELPTGKLLDSNNLTLCDIDYISIFCPKTNFVYGFLSLIENTEDSVPVPPSFIFEKYALGNDVKLQQQPNTYSYTSRPSYIMENYNFSSFSSGEFLKPVTVAVTIVTACLNLLVSKSIF